MGYHIRRRPFGIIYSSVSEQILFAVTPTSEEYIVDPVPRTNADRFECVTRC